MLGRRFENLRHELDDPRRNLTRAHFAFGKPVCIEHRDDINIARIVELFRAELAECQQENAGHGLCRIGIVDPAFLRDVPARHAKRSLGGRVGKV